MVLMLAVFRCGLSPFVVVILNRVSLLPCLVYLRNGMLHTTYTAMGHTACVVWSIPFWRQTM